MAKKEKFPKTQVPRTIEEITKAYQEVAGLFANAEYNSYVLKLKADEYKAQMVELNREASARQALDREAAASAEATSNG
jgi:hypothetical protein